MGLVECTERKQAYTIRASLVVSGKCYKHEEIQNTNGHHRERVHNTEHESQEAGKGDKGIGRESEQEQGQMGNIGVTGGSGDHQNNEEKGGKGQYYCTPPQSHPPTTLINNTITVEILPT